MDRLIADGRRATQAEGRPLSVLNVAYPFAAVAPDTAGGAEQILHMLDAALVARGHRSVVLAADGSIVAGELIAGPRAGGALSEACRARTRAAWAAALCEAVTRECFDLVHLHGIDFDTYLPPPGLPTLVTLHLPLAWYSSAALRPSRPRTFLHCVSAAQAESAELPHLLTPIENGVVIPDRPGVSKAGYALMLTRICPEKGVHLALEAAKRAGVPLVIAGETFPYEEHQRYLHDEILPRLDADRRLIGRVGGAHKADLLARARCLLVASTVAETSSLVAREALAAGTPVIAFARGALPHTIDHGRTGFLVEDVAEMAAAIETAEAIDPVHCWNVARERFSANAMIERYLDVYRTLAAGAVS